MHNIKYFIHIILKCVIMLTLSVCMGCKEDNSIQSKDPVIENRSLKPSKTNINFDAKHNTQQLEIISESVDWNLRNNASWLAISPSTGNKTTNVSISAQEHFSADSSRMAILTLESTTPDYEYERALYVSQNAATPYLTIETNEYAFPGKACNKVFNVNSNSKWSVVSNCEWIIANKLSEGSLKVDIMENPSNDFRKSNIILKNKSGEQTIQITQFASSVYLSQTSIKTEKQPSLFTLEINSDLNWNAVSSADWILLRPADGKAGISNFEIATTENNTTSERTGYVYIYTGNNQKAQIEITQKGLYIKASQANISLSSGAETKEISIESNTDWKIIAAPNWVTVSTNEGSGNQKIEITTTENNSTMERNGCIKIGHNHLDLSCSIDISQKAKTFKTDATVLEFGVKESTQTINIISELPWTSNILDEWITTDITYADSSRSVNVTVSETPSYDERIGSIVYSVVDKEITVNIHQLAKYFTITDKAFNFSSKGGKTNLTFSSNESWKINVKDGADWITLSQKEGEGDGNITINVTDNFSSKKRQGVILINTSAKQIIEIIINQEGRYLRTNTESLFYFSAGGESYISIDTDGKYKISTDSEWITTQKLSDSQAKIKVSKNNEATIRTGYITIQLADIINDEYEIVIPVKQTYEGGIYIDKAFKEEISWDVTSGDSFNISIKSYSTEYNWNSIKKDTITIFRSEHGADDCYDKVNKNVITINKNDYDEDNDWN